MIFQGFGDASSSGSSKAKLGFESSEPRVESSPKEFTHTSAVKVGGPVVDSQQTLFSNLPSNAWESRRHFSTGNGLLPIVMSRRLYSTAPSGSGSGKKKSKPIATDFKSEVDYEN